MKIFKYPIENINDIVPLQMKEGATILHAAFQDDRLCLWAAVDPEAESVIRYIRIYGTGHEMDENEGTYIETVHDPLGGGLVWHLFDLGEENV